MKPAPREKTGQIYGLYGYSLYAFASRCMVVAEAPIWFILGNRVENMESLAKPCSGFAAPAAA